MAPLHPMLALVGSSIGLAGYLVVKVVAYFSGQSSYGPLLVISFMASTWLIVSTRWAPT